MDLQFNYSVNNENIDKEKYFKEEGNLPFDTNSQEQMKVMMQEICAKLSINEEYLVKKLEVVLKYELPFFATNRRLAKNWIIENFIY